MARTGLDYLVILYNANSCLLRAVSSYCSATLLVSTGEAAVPSQSEIPVAGPRFYDGSFEELRFGNSFPDEIEAVSLPYWCPSAIRIWNDRDDARFLRRINVIETSMDDISLSYVLFLAILRLLTCVCYALQIPSKISAISATVSAFRLQQRSTETISQISPPTRLSASLIISTPLSPSATRTGEN